MTTDEVVDETLAVLTSLRGVWDEEAVDELDHALQAATHAAARRPGDDGFVVAALLHDVAHSPLLQGSCGDPDHAAVSLSPTSVDSLARQGGPGAVDVAWTGHPWWDDALELRRCDDAAKVPGAVATRLDDLGPLLARAAGQHR